jgi:hypothetical protein
MADFPKIRIVTDGVWPKVIIATDGAHPKRSIVASGEYPKYMEATSGNYPKIRREFEFANLEAHTLVGAMVEEPSDARKTLIDALISGLKTDGLWNLLDALYVQAAHTSQAGCLNWKQPDLYPLIESGTGTWTTDRDWAGDGISGRLSLNVSPALLTQYQLNSATAFVWSRTSAAQATNAMGLVLGATFQLNPRFTGGSFAGRLNDNVGASTPNADAVGLHTISRTSSTATQFYKNGAAVGAVVATPSGSKNVNNIVLGGHITGYSSWNIAAAGVGAGMDATQNANLYTRLQTFLAAIGAA